MRKDYLEMINNLKAAVRIGHIDSILAAIYSIEELPEIKSNALIQIPLLEKLIIPAGETLKSGRLNWEVIKHLCRSPLTGTRALMASASAHRWLNGVHVKKEPLRNAALDPRKEVRDAFVEVLKTVDSENIDPLWKLAREWILDESPRVQQCAILLLPTFLKEREQEVFNLLAEEAPNGNPDTNAALTEILIEAGGLGYGRQNIDLFQKWTALERPNSWVICKTIGSSWAVEYLQESKLILEQLSSKDHDERLLERTHAALERNSANKQ